jgi:hypothetical protein
MPPALLHVRIFGADAVVPRAQQHAHSVEFRLGAGSIARFVRAPSPRRTSATTSPKASLHALSFHVRGVSESASF